MKTKRGNNEFVVTFLFVCLFFRTLLVSSESISSQLQLNCLNIWLSSTEEIDINGVPAMVYCVCTEILGLPTPTVLQ